jgi:hypothetical protein
MEALTIPVTLYIHYHNLSMLKSKYVVATCDMSRNYPDQYILLETREIDLTINQPEPFDIIALQVDQLRAQKTNIATVAEREIAAVEDKIQQLLCIEHSPVDEHEVPF